MDEEIKIVSEPSSPVPQTTAPLSPSQLPPHASSDPLPQSHTHYADIDDGSWITKQKRKPYQKRDFGQYHMVTRSKSTFDIVSND